MKYIFPEYSFFLMEWQSVSEKWLKFLKIVCFTINNYLKHFDNIG